MNFALGILGVAGFVLALYLACVEWHRYRMHLQMVLMEVKYVGQLKDTHLVLLSVAFVNPASAGKTVFHILGGAPNSEVFSPCPYQYLEDKNSLLFQLPNSDKAVIVQRNELLWLPLDIPPNQSETKWYAALIRRAVEAEEKHPEVHIRLYAQDVLNKQLAKYERNIELRTHRVF
ncbi:MAG: hypothetical protein JXA46_09135 [Dehalococcoidales bacterium]|nr:hypothetical protein [Dehalococcoidales bacterium]